MRLQSPIDAFIYNPAVRPRPYWYFPLALAGMDVLRRANTYRPKFYCLPDDFNQPIPAYGTVEYQVRVTPNSYVWGLLANQYSLAEGQAPGWVVIQAANLFVQITDSCNGLTYFSDFVRGTAAQTLQNVATDQRNAMHPHLLTVPRLVLEPGLLAVELANDSGVALRCQVIIFTAEPCERYVPEQR